MTTTKVDLNNQALDCIIAFADSSYWCYREDPIRDVDGNWIGCIVTDHQDENMPQYAVSKESIESATAQILSGNGGIHSDLVGQCASEYAEYVTDGGEYGIGFDSELSDCIMQIAAMGKVVYG